VTQAQQRRAPEPSAVIIDCRSVKTAAAGALRAYDPSSG
jgi:hypothetical protein